jgi:hypothetical protein
MAKWKTYVYQRQTYVYWYGVPKGGHQRFNTQVRAGGQSSELSKGLLPTPVRSDRRIRKWCSRALNSPPASSAAAGEGWQRRTECKFDRCLVLADPSETSGST